MKFLCSFGLCLAAVVALAAEPSAQRSGLAVPLVRTVHVTAVDRKEVPVGDLTASDFILRENGDVREIVKVEPATAPLHIAIIVDDSGTGIFRVPSPTSSTSSSDARSSRSSTSSGRRCDSSITRRTCSACAPR